MLKLVIMLNATVHVYPAFHMMQTIFMPMKLIFKDENSTDDQLTAKTTPSKISKHIWCALFAYRKTQVTELSLKKMYFISTYIDKA